MARKVKILITVLVFIIFSFLIWKWKDSFNPYIITDKLGYKDGEVLKVTIKNNFEENICFSSCYPYYMEKKNGQWESYTYGSCEENNINETCIESNNVKAFEIDLIRPEDGFHRLALPACLGCNIGDEFREIKRFYSNEFLIKGK